jgi:hypothetical protein
VLWTMRRSALPSVPAVGARTRCTYLKRLHPATAEDRVAGSRLTPDAIEARRACGKRRNRFHR